MPTTRVKSRPVVTLKPSRQASTPKAKTRSRDKAIRDRTLKIGLKRTPPFSLGVSRRPNKSSIPVVGEDQLQQAAPAAHYRALLEKKLLGTLTAAEEHDYVGARLAIVAASKASLERQREMANEFETLKRTQAQTSALVRRYLDK